MFVIVIKLNWFSEILAKQPNIQNNRNLYLIYNSLFGVMIFNVYASKISVPAYLNVIFFYLRD